MATKKVLITGAAGSIGTEMRARLKERYTLRLLDRLPVPEPEGEALVCDLGDLAGLEVACAGMDAVVHLAGNPNGGGSWESLLEDNIRGTYHLFEAARRQGVKRIIFASTNHVTGYYEYEHIYTTPEMLARPDSLYGVSKAFGEDLGRFYVDEHGMGVICLRIGSFQPEEAVGKRGGDRILSTWLSPRDCAQLVWRSIEAEGVKFGIFYGISGNKRAYWDTENARRLLGYAPEDDAEHFV
ncbi:MAG: NAD(P)-dependent oxidoreductase [Candidatus Latescibacteria bacterium]|nr:NAD(P)-dependent oxidoreductase [Candidatus Latescibacterota bacterium]